MSEHECTAECVPPGLVAIRPGGQRVPVTAEPSGERLENGGYVLVVKVPEGPVEAFAADGPLPPEHAFTFVSPEWVRDQARRALLMDKKTDGPDSGPENKEQADE